VAHRRILLLEPLAGAYRGRQETRRIVGHLVIEGEDKALCGYDAGRLVDEYGASGGAVDMCPKCGKRLTAMVARGAARRTKGTR